MEKDILSRQHLESMSTQDLLSLADEYGIDIPDNLNRRFIIGELLEAAEEFENDSKDEDALLTEESSDVPDTLPDSYNETTIDLLLRNPAWIFTFWDISEADKNRLKNNDSFEGIFLHTSFFTSMDEEEKAEDSFDVKIDFETREQYILIPAGKKIVMISLAAGYSDAQPEVLASTKRIEIPCESESIQKMEPGKKLGFSQLINLSGMKTILHDHYLNHRQSFSN